MYVEGISLGYMEMETLSGLRTFSCEGRSNCGVMFGSGGDECAAFASLESRDLQIRLRLRVRVRVFQCVPGAHARLCEAVTSTRAVVKFSSPS